MRFWHNGNEFTKKVEKLDASSYTLNYQTGDYVYVGSDFPFNHFYLKVLVGANVTAEMSIEYYSSNWQSVVDIQDETLGLSNEGFVEFTPDKNNNWQMKDSEKINGLTFKAYDKYWTRISFDSPFTATLDFCGNKFSDDNDLYSEFPVFDNADYKTAFKTGKTSWEEQHIKAAEIIIQDLKKKNIIFGKEQILDRNVFLGASVQKCAELIYNAFGNDFITQKEQARTEYGRRLDLGQFNIDSNNDAILNHGEVKERQQWVSR